MVQHEHERTHSSRRRMTVSREREDEGRDLLIDRQTTERIHTAKNRRTIPPQPTDTQPRTARHNRHTAYSHTTRIKNLSKIYQKRIKNLTETYLKHS